MDCVRARIRKLPRGYLGFLHVAGERILPTDGLTEGTDAAYALSARAGCSRWTIISTRLPGDGNSGNERG
jgi:hypothetical protein